jgi:hypothetical protein
VHSACNSNRRFLYHHRRPKEYLWDANCRSSIVFMTSTGRTLCPSRSSIESSLLRYGQQTSLPACGGGSREAFGVCGDHAAGPLTSNSCFSGFEVSRAYRILATILANLSCSRESHSGGFTVLCSASPDSFTSYLASSSRTRMAKRCRLISSPSRRCLISMRNLEKICWGLHLTMIFPSETGRHSAI